MNLINKQLLIEDLKTKKWISILSSIALLVIYLIIFVSHFLDTGRGYDYSVYIIFVIFLILLFPFVVLLVGLYNFSFIHGKPKVDFYHGLPIQRKTLYCTNYLSGLILSFLPFILFGALALLVGFFVLHTQTFPYPNAYPSTYYDEFTFMFKVFIRAIFLVFVGYSFIGLCANLTGKLFSHITTIIISVVAPIIIILFTLIYTQISINRGIRIENFINSITNFIFDIDLNSLESRFGNLTVNKISVITTITIFLIGMLFNILSLYFYKNYKSENTGKFFTNNFSLLFYKYLTIIIIAIVLTSIPIFSTTYYVAYTDYFSKCILFFSVFFSTSLLLYIIITVISEGGFSKNTINLKSIVTIVIITIVYNTIALLDPLGLREFTPKVEKLQSIELDYVTYDNPEDFQDLIEIHLSIIEEEGDNNESATPQNTTTITYNYKNGKKVSRYYRYYLTENIKNNFENYFTSDNYKNYVIDSLENYQSENFNNDDSYYTRNRGGITLYKFFSYTYTMDSDEIKQFLDAFILDIKADTEFGKYNEQNFGFMSVSYDNEYFYNHNFYKKIGLLPTNIKSNYTNSMSFVEKLVEKPSDENEYYILTYRLDDFQNLKNDSLLNNHYLQYYYFIEESMNKLSLNFDNVNYLKDPNHETLTDYYSDENVRDVELISYNENYDEFMKFMNTKKTFITDGYSRYMIFDKDKDLYVANIIETSGDTILKKQKLGGFYK